MDGIRDRFNGRDRGVERNTQGRYERIERNERSDRMERPMDRSMDRSMDRPMDRGMRRGMSFGVDGFQTDEVSSAIEQSNAKQTEILADYIEDVKGEVYASEKEILKAIDEVSGGRGARNQAPQEPVVVPTVDPTLKDDLMQAILGNSNLLNMIRESLEKQDEEQEVIDEGVVDPAAELKAALAEYFSNMEDHVHKENVKCYRNVQAALQEQGAQDTEQSGRNLGSIKIFTIINMVLAVINIALLACFIFGIL